MKAMIPAALLILALAIGCISANAQDQGARRGPGNRGPRGPQSGGAAYEAAPIAKDDAEKKILQALQEIVDAGRGISAPRDDARLLRLLVESTGAKHAVELGTFRGYSSIWMCLGLRKTGGKLTTFEIDKEAADLSRQNFKRAGVEEMITLIEGDAHKEVGKLKGPVDLVFIDADKEGYADYLIQLMPMVRPGGLFVAHNIDAGRADPAFIKAITTNPELETVFVSAGRGGLSVSMKKR